MHHMHHIHHTSKMSIKFNSKYIQQSNQNQTLQNRNTFSCVHSCVSYGGMQFAVQGLQYCHSVLAPGFPVIHLMTSIPRIWMKSCQTCDRVCRPLTPTVWHASPMAQVPTDACTLFYTQLSRQTSISQLPLPYL